MAPSALELLSLVSPHPSGAGRWRCLITTAVVLLVLAAVAFAQTQSGRTAIRKLGLGGATEAFTELYFVDPATIAAVTERPAYGRSTQLVQFAVRSHQRKAQRYLWSITLNGHLRKAGSMQLAPGELVVIARRLTIRCPLGPSGTLRGRPRTRIQVSLRQPLESISYWFSCHA